MNRVIAVDWSGAKIGAGTKIWLAEVRDGRLTRLESGRDGIEVVEHLIDDAVADPDVVIGLDFAFSFPRWFAKKRGAKSIEDLWNLVAEEGEEWLRNCPHPFWGRSGKRKPKLCEHFRLTEKRASEQKGAIPQERLPDRLRGRGRHGLDPRHAAPGDTPSRGLLDLALSPWNTGLPGQPRECRKAQARIDWQGQQLVAKGIVAGRVGGDALTEWGKPFWNSRSSRGSRCWSGRSTATSSPAGTARR